MKRELRKEGKIAADINQYRRICGGDQEIFKNISRIVVQKNIVLKR